MVIESPRQDGGNPRHKIERNAKNHEVGEGETEDDAGDYRPKDKDSGEPIAIDGARQKEPEGGSAVFPEPHDASAELQVAAEEPDFLRGSQLGGLGNIDKKGNRKDDGPDGGPEGNQLERRGNGAIQDSTQNEADHSGESDDAS